VCVGDHVSTTIERRCECSRRVGRQRRVTETLHDITKPAMPGDARNGVRPRGPRNERTSAKRETRPRRSLS
jgi:hypothetical protein